MKTTDAPFELNAHAQDRVRFGDPVYFELFEFLQDEAMVLDHNRMDDWLNLLSEDLFYWMPIRVTRDRADGEGFAEQAGHFEDTYASIALRVRRLTKTRTAWAEDPPSRVRRFVNNVIVYRTSEINEYRVTSSILLIRTRFDTAKIDMITAERHDVIRRNDMGWRLARREIYADQSTLAMSNLAVFL